MLRVESCRSLGQNTLTTKARVTWDFAKSGSHTWFVKIRATIAVACARNSSTPLLVAGVPGACFVVTEHSYVHLKTLDHTPFCTKTTKLAREDIPGMTSPHAFG